MGGGGRRAGLRIPVIISSTRGLKYIALKHVAAIAKKLEVGCPSGCTWTTRQGTASPWGRAGRFPR